jgi:hypothetical protein
MVLLPFPGLSLAAARDVALTIPVRGEGTGREKLKKELFSDIPLKSGSAHLRRPSAGPLIGIRSPPPGGPGSWRHIPGTARERDFPESGEEPYFRA